MLENKFQAKLIKRIKDLFPGCIVMKNDSSYIQGIPDLLVLNNSRWASLECKKNANAKKQPNQEYYVDKMDSMSFSRFICPENEDEVLEELNKHIDNLCDYKDKILKIGNNIGASSSFAGCFLSSCPAKMVCDKPTNIYAVYCN